MSEGIISFARANVFVATLLLLFVVGISVVLVLSNTLRFFSNVESTAFINRAPEVSFTSRNLTLRPIASSSPNFSLEQATVAGATTTSSEAVVIQEPTAEPTPKPVTPLVEPVVAFINSLRASAGVGLYIEDAVLHATAQNYASILAKNCSALIHSDLSTFLGDQIIHGQINAVAENLGWHSATLDGALATLQASSGHLANMISTEYTYVGTGVAIGQAGSCEGRVYVVQHFAGI